MTTTIRTLMVGVGISLAFQASLHAQESGKTVNPVRFSVSSLAQATDNRDAVLVMARALVALDQPDRWFHFR